jgi:hypothetical protein
LANDLSDVVEVLITRETASIDTASFNIPGVLATFTNFSERARSYTTITGVAEDFNTSSNVYKMATKLFGQQLKPPSIVVGRRQVDEVTITPTVANSATYTVTLNDIAYSFVSDASATAAEISLGLVTAIGVVAGITVTDLIGSFTVETSTSGTAWSISVSTNLVKVDTTPTETWTDALIAMESENDSFYALTCESHIKADIEEIAEAIQARRKVYFTSTADTDVPTTSITDIASILSDANYDRTSITYLTQADSDFPECAWVGSQLPEQPGSNDWNLKSVSGVTIDRLTETQKTNLRNKNCNFFTRKAGVEVFQDGNQSSGAPTDEVIFIDWLVARLEESVFFRMVNTKKIPFTRPGATIIENDIRTVASQGVAVGGIAPAPAFTVQSPDPLLIPAPQRAQRIMGDFVLTFRLAGSVRKVIIRGVASV